MPGKVREMILAYEAMMFAREVHKDQRRKLITPEIATSEAEREMKWCSCCSLEKAFSEFNRCYKARHGLHNHCRECQSATKRAHYEKNSEKEKAAAKLRRSTHEAKLAWKAKYASDEAFRERVLAYNRQRRKSDKARMLANAARRKLEEGNPSAKLARNLRVRLRRAMLGERKSDSMFSLLGCTAEELRTHLERQFTDGMSWENYGYRGWHIDHFRPCASFDLSDHLQQRICFHYTNLRPMWGVMNQSKNDTIPVPYELPFNAELAFSAMSFAMDKHRNQKRKYTGEEYFSHLAQVAGLAATVTDENVHLVMAVAYLHDIREDQGVSSEELIKRFGPEVAAGVDLLSDLETGNRAERKAASRARLAEAPGWIQTIKCADLISNTSSIVMHDPKFAETYLEEKRLLLEVMTKADPRLRDLALRQVS